MDKDSINRANEQLNNIEEFIKHNVGLGYITEQQSIGELLKYIKNIKTQYIPLVEKLLEFERKNMIS